MTEVFRQRNAQRIVGTSILLLLVLAAATVLLLLHKNEFFSESNLYYLQADQSQLRGLRKSMDVRILGEPVGTVTDISYVGSSNEVRLTMQVKVHEDDTKNVIWENSQIVVARSFGIGEPFLEIERGVDLLGAIVSNLLDPEANAIRAEGAKSRGVKIQRLVKGSPAEAAGLAKNDIITSFNGQPVNNLGELYDYMSRVARGSNLQVGIHGRESPIAMKAELVDPKRLEAGGTIIQFQPEPDRLEELTDKLSLVQESIANVEVSMVDTLSDQLVPTLNQFTKTGQSVEETSDQVRRETLQRVNDSLAKIDESTQVFNERLDQIAKSFDGLVDERAGPAFDSFNQASRRLGDASNSLKDTSDTIGTESTVALKDLQRAALTLNDVLDRSRVIVDVLQSEVYQLPGTAAKINQAANGANEVIDEAKVVVNDAKGAINGANDVIDGAKEHWLLRRAVKRSQDKKAGIKKTGPIRSLLGH